MNLARRRPVKEHPYAKNGSKKAAKQAAKDKSKGTIFVDALPPKKMRRSS